MCLACTLDALRTLNPLAPHPDMLMLPAVVQLLVDCGDGLPAVELPVQQGTRVAELKAMLLSSGLGLALGKQFELLAHNPGLVSPAWLRHSCTQS